MLLDILQYKRRHNSDSEQEFITRFIDTLPGIHQDGFGNRYLRIGQSSTLFSCHTDTVHRDGGRQKILYDAELNIIYKDDGDPLGADDGAGIWLLLQMIDAQIPGLYIFHRAEEAGGQGSSYIASKTPELLTGIERAIAFDRRGTKDIITHQGGDRCCSEAFATALAKELYMKHKPSPNGIFTDTANYVELIPECTNISIGYDGEHTPQELLDVDYLFELVQAVQEVNWEHLPTTRTPQPRFTSIGYYDDWNEVVDLPVLRDLVEKHPEVAIRLLEMCNPDQMMLEEAFEDVELFSDERYNL